MYTNLEKKFNVIYPENEKATYSSLLNYSDDMTKARQQWYRYKEGFSIELVKKLIQEYNRDEKGIILDPFLGSGSTVMASNALGLKGIGFEVNPFSYFLSCCKLKNYSKECVLEMENKYKSILEDAKQSRLYSMPKLSISHKVFEDSVEEYFMSVKMCIDNNDYQFSDTKNLLRLGWLACIEPLSIYRKTGNGLKKKKYVHPKVMTKDDVLYLLTQQYTTIISDIKNNQIAFDAEIYHESCFGFAAKLTDAKISGIIFSPPYANCFDYTEIYKLELWFGEFVKEYSDLKQLRKASLHSHLNGCLDEDCDTHSVAILHDLINQIKTISLWDKKIPKMLELYYNDMFHVIQNCYDALEVNGFCSIIVGNSAYGGIIFPADLIFAEFAQQVGFTVDKIEVDRYIITSSQQYEKTKENKRFLRESVICLIKK